MTDLKESLVTKLQQDRLAPPDVLEGIEQCFVLTHRSFLSKRRPELTIQEIDDLSRDLLETVLDEELKSLPRPSETALRDAVVTLDERFGFVADPDLQAEHETVINTLIGRMTTP
ncbi:MAG: hypothetical protein GYB64_03230 [Chloroflexi bacterium]|nr:hypothetical protein [Chloroflexota bacterium]